MSSESRYRPGVCNIGASERRKRYRYAAVAFAAAVGYLLVVLASGAPPILLVGLFVPVSLGVELALQARRDFCAALALSGRYSFDDESGAVEDPSARRTDRNVGIRFVCVGLAAGAVTSALAYGVAVSL